MTQTKKKPNIYVLKLGNAFLPSVSFKTGMN